jgi:hypothetical protein
MRSSRIPVQQPTNPRTHEPTHRNRPRNIVVPTTMLIWPAVETIVARDRPAQLVGDLPHLPLSDGEHDANPHTAEAHSSQWRTRLLPRQARQLVAHRHGRTFTGQTVAPALHAARIWREVNQCH